MAVSIEERRKKDRERKRKDRKDIKDGYVIQQMKKNCGFTSNQISPELIDLYRQHISNHRLIKALEQMSKEGSLLDRIKELEG